MDKVKKLERYTTALEDILFECEIKDGIYRQSVIFEKNGEKLLFREFALEDAKVQTDEKPKIILE